MGRRNRSHSKHQNNRRSQPSVKLVHDSSDGDDSVIEIDYTKAKSKKSSSDKKQNNYELKKPYESESESDYDDMSHYSESSDVESKKTDTESSEDESNNESGNDSDDEELMDKCMDNKSKRRRYDELSDLGKLMRNRMMSGHRDINVLGAGKVSSGKSTLINALLQDKYTETKVQKSTAGMSIYIPSNDNVQTASNIYQQNKISNAESHEFSQYYVNFPTFCNIKNGNLTYNINFIDTVGNDDPDQDKFTYDWINKNKEFIDIYLIVIDITHGLITRSNRNNLDELIKHFGNSSILFVVNKFDEQTDEELRELYNECVQNIDLIMTNKSNNYKICGVSALKRYVTVMTESGKHDKLTAKEKIVSIDKFDNSFSNMGLQLVEMTKDVIMNKTLLTNKILKILQCDVSNESHDEYIEKFAKILNMYQSDNLFTANEIDLISEQLFNKMEDKVKYMTDNYFKNNIYGISNRLRSLDIQHRIFTKCSNIGCYKKMCEIFNVKSKEIFEFSDDDINSILIMFMEKYIDDDSQPCTCCHNVNHLSSYAMLTDIIKKISINGKDTINKALDIYITFLITISLESEEPPIDLKNSHNRDIDMNESVTSLIYSQLFEKYLHSQYLSLFEDRPELQKLLIVMSMHNKSIHANKTIKRAKFILKDLDMTNIAKYFEYFQILFEKFYTK